MPRLGVRVQSAAQATLRRRINRRKVGSASSHIGPATLRGLALHAGGPEDRRDPGPLVHAARLTRRWASSVPPPALSSPCFWPRVRIATEVTAPQTVPAFEATFEADGYLQALPVVLDDPTGLVTKLTAMPPDAGPTEEGVTSLAGQADVLVARWLGGVCDRHVTLTFAAVAGGYQLVERTEVDPTRSCTLQGFMRTLEIGLSMPINARTVNFVQPPD